MPEVILIKHKEAAVQVENGLVPVRRIVSPLIKPVTLFYQAAGRQTVNRGADRFEVLDPTMSRNRLTLPDNPLLIEKAAARQEIYIDTEVHRLKIVIFDLLFCCFMSGSGIAGAFISGFIEIKQDIRNFNKTHT